MNKWLMHSGQLLSALAVLLLTACGAEDAQEISNNPSLAPCSASGSVFEDWKFNDWKDNYHEKVGAALDAHLEILRNVPKQPLQCANESAEDVIPASGPLQEIAQGLPAWKYRMGDLGEGDLPVVLMEFLRVYECSMFEYAEDHVGEEIVQGEGSVAESTGETNTTTAQDEEDGLFSWFSLISRDAFIEKRINEETQVARPALERALSFTQGYDRLHPLTTDIECLKRTSLDLRNVFGLISDASSCLPRIWDAQGALYDVDFEESQP